MENKNSLFLHMGPGFHCKVEKSSFSTTYPHMEFWDQPTELGSESPFKRLVEMTSKKIEDMAKAFGSPIQIHAHSFGGLLATASLPSVLSSVSSCTFYSTGFEFHNSFINLLKFHLNENKAGNNTKAIRSFLEKFPSAESLDIFSQSVQLASAMPNFAESYWANKQAMASYFQVAANYPSPDPELFFHIASDFLKNHKKLENENLFQGPVKIFLGSQDPLIQLDREVQTWTKVFPTAEIQIIPEMGHFLHYESPNLFDPQ